MVVQHNLRAMNSNRMLGITAGQQAKSSEKLSSGYKINRAADDAAGLSISEKMRKQIRGLTQASLNAQDGISAVQTAEGALTEVHDMLQRMNELAVKAGNGTMSEDDRQNVQDEIDQLVTEIDRVSETTKFNETYLLKGTTESNGNAATIAATTEVGSVNGVTISTDGAEVTITDGDTVQIQVNNIMTSADNATFKSANAITDATNAELAKVDKVVCTTAGTVANARYSVTLKDGSVISDVSGTVLEGTYKIKQETNAAKGDSITIGKGLSDTAVNGLKATKTDEYTGNVAVGDSVNLVAAVDKAGKVTLTENTKALALDFQVGADTTSENKINVTMESMSANSIGISGIKVTGSNSSNADKAVNTIGNAIKKVSAQRSALGAVQNRLEHTINNLDNVVENTTAAESQIRDTDMATEMVKYSNNNILAQAGQAMLAQSNQANQGVLSLLQ